MFDINEELKKLPEKPGVYLMFDENNQIIYVGKAIVLKNRVRQYFQQSSKKNPKVRAMVSNIKKFEYIITSSELEALILECNLIKKYRPKYNVLMKDDKSYPYIKVTMNEEYPRIFMSRKLLKDGAKYFGPYSSVTSVKETLDLIRKLFPIKSCNKVFPRDIGKTRPCLNYHIFHCIGPCSGNVNKDNYRKMMKDICGFLNGKHEEVIKNLEMQMKEFSDKLEFERAASLRDKINSLKHIAEKQKVLSTTMENQDVIAFAKGDTDSCIQVFFIRSGKLIGREHFIFENTMDVENREIMASFVKQFYNSAAYVPNSILLQEDIDEIKIIERWLSDKRDSKVHIKVPRKGEKLELVNMVSQNALAALNQYKENIKIKDSFTDGSVKKLTKILNLDNEARRIEAYDISNTGESEIVSSMVVFEDGKPQKRDYRRFKIKSVEGQNDYGSMQEAVYRRLKRLVKNGEDTNSEFINSIQNDSFTKAPNLILVDGGIGHVNSVNEVLKELSLNILVVGMVKDSKHRTRGLIYKGNEIDLSKDIELLRFITAIQDEAHRFAVEYNRKLRDKRYKQSILDEIKDIGPKRKKALIKHFGSIKKIKEASVEDLVLAEGINRATAEKIVEYFR